jgi:hypothetical protein
VKFSALSHTTGGIPSMERGSDSFKAWKMGNDSGTGILVLMVRYLVDTCFTSTGCNEYSAMNETPV